MTKIRALIVDDSRAVCRFLTEVLERDDDIDVVGYAQDALEARAMIKAKNPDVLTLDVEMPRMDGLTFLKNLMRLRPMPVVMISTQTTPGAEQTLEALRIGAVDYVVKRQPVNGVEYEVYLQQIISKVKAAASTRVQPYDEQLEQAGSSASQSSGRAETDAEGYAAARKKAGSLAGPNECTKAILAVGASTGGPEAVREVLNAVYSPSLCVLVTQHMPARFMGPFSERLNSETGFSVMQASTGAQLKGGQCYVAPGDQHLSVSGKGATLRLVLDDSPACSGHRPSVDVMFGSLAQRAARSTIAVLLTGMGNDGAQGMLALHKGGTLTIAQDETSSTVWGMPGSAVKLGAVDLQLKLQNIAPTIKQLLNI